jgi:hypothetical protein
MPRTAHEHDSKHGDHERLGDNHDRNWDGERGGKEETSAKDDTH